MIAAQVGAEDVRHRAFENSYHLLSLDYERNIVADEIVRFFEEQFSRGQSDAIRNLD